MSPDDTVRLLEDLCAIPGISGEEGEVADFLDARLGPLLDASGRDALGNWLGRRAPRPAAGGRDGAGAEAGRDAAERAPRLILSAHMDAIGFIVTGVESGGFLRFGPVGGWDPRLLLGLPVTVLGRKSLPGLVGSRPPHVLGPELARKVLPWEELFIDCGLPEEELRRQVRVGDLIAPRRELQRLQGRRHAGRALDNRASLAALVLAVEALAARQHEAEILVLATAQEEVGRGAGAGVWSLEADAALVLDVTFAGQPGVAEVPGSLGGGPLVGVGPNLHPVIEAHLRRLAQAAELKHGREPLPGSSGTDAWAMQVSAAGLPCGLISIPIRNMHATVEMVDLADLERAARLVAEFAARFDAAFAGSLVPELHGVSFD